MIRFAEPLAFVAPPPTIPGWATPRGPVESAAEAAFLAGAALNTLDNLVRAAPPWAGAWRQRLALKAAAAAVRRIGHREDEGALRDAWICARRAPIPDRPGASSPPGGGSPSGGPRSTKKAFALSRSCWGRRGAPSWPPSPP